MTILNSQLVSICKLCRDDRDGLDELGQLTDIIVQGRIAALIPIVETLVVETDLDAYELLQLLYRK